MSYTVDVTDAKYVRIARHVLHTPDANDLVRDAKAIAGWTGAKCRVATYDGGMTITSQKTKQIIFVEIVDTVKWCA